MNETKKTKTETKTGTENENRKTVIIKIPELSDILFDETGKRFEPKRIRSIFRNDIELSELFDDGKYTSYNFEYPSNIVNRIIKRFIEIEKSVTEKTKRSTERKTERKNKSFTVFDIDESGKRISKRLRNDGTVIEPTGTDETK